MIESRSGKMKAVIGTAFMALMAALIVKLQPSEEKKAPASASS
jgi:hypothetical protein